ncbi:hypothetical protein KL953_11550 [Mycolicibacterium goodii]|uniref:hypothetical protein n=1 Tax=Mycolicibacterium goodii TaxID=134601 RepID=UPI001BDC4F18|nr:hypothetical protein [Mycolicibacterium goodii]MBU8809530.1 hypothetical protein [Mycolicibacterium goodii]
MTNFGGDNPIGGGPAGPPHGFPPAGQPVPPPPGPYPQGPVNTGFGGGFGAPPAGPGPFPGGAFHNPQNAHSQDGPTSFGAPAFELPTFNSAPPKKRRRLFGIVAGAVVGVVVLVVGIVMFTGDSGSDAKTASGAVEGYLKALAKGDAEKALSFGINEPPDKTYLTDEVLRKQLDKMPITDIKIVGEDANSVHFLANFGDQPVDQELSVKQGGDGLFKVQYTTYSLNFGKDEAKGSTALLDSFSIFGEPLPESGIAYLFPGAIEVTTSNPYLKLDYRRDAYLPSWIPFLEPEEDADFELAITEEGKKAADKAIMDAMIECAKSTSPGPPNCPQGEAYVGRNLVEGSAHWTAPTNTDKIRLSIEPAFLGGGLDGHATVNGAVDFKLTARGVDPSYDMTDETVRVEVGGYVDFTKNPPTYTYE